MSRWPTEHHFTSWLTLAPRNKISGGRLPEFADPGVRQPGSEPPPGGSDVPRSGQTALGAFYRRLAARVGKAKGITATARKLAILVYRALKGELAYHDPGAHGLRCPTQRATRSPVAHSRLEAGICPRGSENRRAPRSRSFLGGKIHRLSLHECRIYGASLWSRELRGHVPARPGRPRLISGFCSSPRRSCYAASFSAPLTVGTLRFTRVVATNSPEDFHLQSMFMLGTHKKRGAPVYRRPLFCRPSDRPTYPICFNRPRVR